MNPSCCMSELRFPPPALLSSPFMPSFLPLRASSSSPNCVLYGLYCVSPQLSPSLHTLLPNYPLIRNLLFSCHFLFLSPLLIDLSTAVPTTLPAPLPLSPFGLLHLVSPYTFMPSVLISFLSPSLAPLSINSRLLSPSVCYLLPCGSVLHASAGVF